MLFHYSFVNSFVNFKTRINNGISILFDFRIQNFPRTRSASCFINHAIRFREPLTTTVYSRLSMDDGDPGQGLQNVRLFNKKCKSIQSKNISPKKIKWSLYHPKQSKNIDEKFFAVSKFKSENVVIRESFLFDGSYDRIENTKKVFDNGDSFEGELFNGVRHGKGTYRFKVRSF